MRAAAGFVAGWFLAALVAVLAAGQGVSLVADRVTSDRPEPLTSVEVRAALSGSPAPTSTSTSTSTTVVDEGGASGGASDPPRTVTSTTIPTTSSGTGSGGSLAGGAGQGSSSGSTTSTTLPPQGGEVVTPPGPIPSFEARTYALVGGTATLRFSPSGVELVVAEPRAGYSLTIEPEHGNGLTVDFRKGDRRSRVDGWWDGGPQERVREE